MTRVLLVLGFLSLAAPGTFLLAVSMPLAAPAAEVTPGAFGDVGSPGGGHEHPASSATAGRGVGRWRGGLSRNADRARSVIRDAAAFVRSAWAPTDYGNPPNGLAVAGFVLSLSFPFTSILGPLLGVIFSAIALGRAVKYPQYYGRRKMALAGLIVGGAFLIVVGSIYYVLLVVGG